MHEARYLDRVEQLCQLSLHRLPKMIDPASGLFVFRADEGDLVPAGASARYTAITALGIDQALSHGLECTIDLAKIFAALDAGRATLDNCGDLGLVLWATARRAKPVAERALSDLLRFGELTQRRNGSAYHSTELAWVVTGLAEALANDVGREREVRAKLDTAYARLMQNQGASGLMAFARSIRPSTTKLRWQATLGFFDAQVYSIVASLRRDAVVGDRAARETALAIGQQILKHQRSLGQWAWHYNADTGALVDLYPVYSVHQDGMAPMALLLLERVLGVPTTSAVARGVEWLFGQNELGVRMVELDRSLVWRSIRRRDPFRRVVYPLKAVSIAGLTSSALGTRLSSPSVLEVDREMRPYHLGWCLYAFAELAASARRAKRPAA